MSRTDGIGELWSPGMNSTGGNGRFLNPYNMPNATKSTPFRTLRRAGRDASASF